MTGKLSEHIKDRLEQLGKLGLRIASHRGHRPVFEEILTSMIEFTNSAGGILYSLPEGLRDRITLGNISNPGEAYLRQMATFVAVHGQVENIENVYMDDRFDTDEFNKLKSDSDQNEISLLAVPLINVEKVCIGVIQLVRNSNVSSSNKYSEEDVHLAILLASQGAMTLANSMLRDDQDKLIESFVKVIATAIDDKSISTGSHCKRVPILTMMIADQALEDDGIFNDFTMTDEERYELKIASLLHDCGKITTPVNIVDKATKLETIFDRIKFIKIKFEVIDREAKIRFLEQKIRDLENGTYDKERFNWQEKKYKLLKKKIMEDFKFLEKANIGSEFMTPFDQERVVEMSRQYGWRDFSGEYQNLLTEDEVKNLVISKGTLTDGEREIINRHIVLTIKMLEQIHFPEYLRRVPEFAGCHHERMDGTGFPRGLKRYEMSLQARMMGLADIFEALTAKDRPYKKGMTLFEALNIMGGMIKDGYVDPDIFNFFIDKKIYMKYAEKYLSSDQIDEVDITKINGYIIPEDRKKAA